MGQTPSMRKSARLQLLHMLKQYPNIPCGEHTGNKKKCIANPLCMFNRVTQTCAVLPVVNLLEFLVAGACNIGTRLTQEERRAVLSVALTLGMPIPQVQPLHFLQHLKQEALPLIDTASEQKLLEYIATFDLYVPSTASRDVTLDATLSEEAQTQLLMQSGISFEDSLKLVHSGRSVVYQVSQPLTLEEKRQAVRSKMQAVQPSVHAVISDDNVISACKWLKDHKSDLEQAARNAQKVGASWGLHDVALVVKRAITRPETYRREVRTMLEWKPHFQQRKQDLKNALYLFAILYIMFVQLSKLVDTRPRTGVLQFMGSGHVPVPAQLRPAPGVVPRELFTLQDSAMLQEASEELGQTVQALPQKVYRGLWFVEAQPVAASPHVHAYGQPDWRELDLQTRANLINTMQWRRFAERVPEFKAKAHDMYYRHRVFAASARDAPPKYPFTQVASVMMHGELNVKTEDSQLKVDSFAIPEDMIVVQVRGTVRGSLNYGSQEWFRSGVKQLDRVWLNALAQQKASNATVFDTILNVRHRLQDALTWQFHEKSEEYEMLSDDNYGVGHVPVTQPWIQVFTPGDVMPNTQYTKSKHETGMKINLLNMKQVESNDVPYLTTEEFVKANYLAGTRVLIVNELSCQGLVQPWFSGQQTLDRVAAVSLQEKLELQTVLDDYLYGTSELVAAESTLEPSFVPASRKFAIEKLLDTYKYGPSVDPTNLQQVMYAKEPFLPSVRNRDRSNVIVEPLKLYRRIQDNSQPTDSDAYQTEESDN